MRSVTLTGLVGLVFLAACHVEVSSGGGGGGGGGGQPARAPARAQNNPPPAPAPAPAPNNNRVGARPVGQNPAPPATPAQPPQASQPGMVAAYKGDEVVNVAVIKDI